MKPQVHMRPAAEIDLEEIAVLIARDRPRTALRFLAAAEKTFELLSHFPRLGAIVPQVPASRGEVRFHPIKRFKTFLAIYRPATDGVEILRVLHGRRNIGAILDA